MATAKKKKSTKRSKQKALPLFGKGVKDERFPKIFGLVLVLFSIYLFIAFTSYLFTWYADQSEVIGKTTLQVLFGPNVEVTNWLGRLGALVSFAFFYKYFGLSSFIFVFLFGITGLTLMTRRPMRKLFNIYGYSLILLTWFSTFFAFLFSAPGLIMQSEFSWGGGFGEYISVSLNAIFGNIGMSLLLLFTLFIIGIWVFNPNFNELTWERFLYRIRKSTGLNLSFLSPLFRSAPAEEPKTEDQTETEKKSTVPLKPNGTKKSVNEMYAENEKGEKEKPLTPKNQEKTEEKPQLAFDLVDKQKPKKPQTIKSIEEANLEIESGDNKKNDPATPLSIQTENKDASAPYDPTLELPNYESPRLTLLESYDEMKIEIDRAELEMNKDQIIETLLNYKIEIVKIKATIGPTVTLYEIVPAPGVRISKIKNLEDDIALSLSALGIRIIAPIPGRGTIGIEVPNKNKQIVSLKEVLYSEKYQHAKMDLPIALGKTISNEVFVADLTKMPHLLIAGATGQGKSVGINTIIMSLLYKKHPSQLKLVLIDPKKVELSLYNKIENHFLAFLPGEEEAILTDTSKVVSTLNSLCIEMEQRYDLLKKGSVRNIREYNKKFVARKLNPLNGHQFLPYIVLVIDEFADMIMTAGKEVELPLGRLAQLSRAVGIHLIIATQRPSVNIITGVIKANFPARIAYKVTSKIDSRTILDGGGAEQLIGRGDMLLSVDAKVIRLQCAFVDTPEVERVIDDISGQPGYPEPFLLPEFGVEDESGLNSFNVDDLDDLFEDAARTVVQNQIGSTSMLQRRLKLGYNRAGRIMDQMEAVGIVGPSEGSKAREVLIYDEIELERFLEQLRKKKKKLF